MSEGQQKFIDFVRTEVADIRSDYPGLVSNGDAFAVWSAAFLHDLSYDEALEVCATQGSASGDGGVDGVFVDETDGIVYLLQCKFAVDPALAAYDAEPFNELQSGLNRMLSPVHAAQIGGEFDAKATAVREALAGGADLVLEAVVFGGATPGLRSAAEAVAVALPDLRAEGTVWDLVRLEQEWIDRNVVKDLKGQRLTLATAADLVTLPDVGVDGMTTYALAVLDGHSLAQAAAKYGSQIVDMNVRYQLRRSKINDAIAETAATPALQPKFLVLNNGLTVLCDGLQQADDRRSIALENPQIVNGAQTALTLADKLPSIRPGDVRVLARIMVLAGAGSLGLAQQISESTNRQNPVTPADLKAHDPLQLRIDKELKLLSPRWYYERKRNSFASLSDADRKAYVKAITKEDLAQRYRAMIGDPAKAITAKSAVFDGTTLYGKIFDASVPVEHYLLAHEMFGYFYSLMNKSREAERLSLYAEFDEDLRGLLSRARAQWSSHCTALAYYLLEKKYTTVGPGRSMEMVKELQSSASAYRPLFSLVVMTVIKWAEIKRAKAVEEQVDFSIRDEFESASAFVELRQEANSAVHWYKSQTFDLLPD